MTSYAKIIADSISPLGHRLTTFEVRFHRFVLAEFNTHRVFSRNSASSRAIPATKNLDDVYSDMASPVEWRAEKRGMQGGDILEEADRDEALGYWARAAHNASVAVEDLIDVGVHKSIVNRLLEPFMWHTVIVSATAWGNFFAQRVSPLAQPEIRVAAEMMLEEYEKSQPNILYEGQWHLPYLQPDEEDGLTTPARKRVSVARCARVSYMTHDGVRDVDKDLELYERLVSADPMHASPLEHVATPDFWNVAYYQHPLLAVGEGGKVTQVPKLGNFLGWRQHRLEVETERGIQSYA